LFDKATLLFPAKLDGTLDIGRILDAMLYYQKIEFIVDERGFCQLWARLGAEGTLSLLSHPSFDSKITPEFVAVLNDNSNGLIAHKPQFISRAGDSSISIDDKDTPSKLAFAVGRN
jgi:hypothetical protein